MKFAKYALALAIIASFIFMTLSLHPTFAVLKNSHAYRAIPGEPAVEPLTVPYDAVDEFCMKCHEDEVYALRTETELSFKVSKDCYYCHEAPHAMPPTYCSDCHTDPASAIGEEKKDVHWTMTYEPWGYEEHYPTYPTVRACVACHTKIDVAITYERIHTLNYTLTYKK